MRYKNQHSRKLYDYLFTYYFLKERWQIEIPLKPAGDSAGSQQVIPEEDSTLLHTENCREFK
jgi:hypothetical protein